MRSTTLANVAILLATASCARQKYKGAPPEALHTAILHGGGVEGVLFLVGHCRSSHDLRF